MGRDKIIISDSLGGGLDWMQRGSEGWEKGGKAGQDANMTNQPARGTPFE